MLFPGHFFGHGSHDEGERAFDYFSAEISKAMQLSVDLPGIKALHQSTSFELPEDKPDVSQLNVGI